MEDNKRGIQGLRIKIIPLILVSIITISATYAGYQAAINAQQTNLQTLQQENEILQNTLDNIDINTQNIQQLQEQLNATLEKNRDLQRTINDLKQSEQTIQQLQEQLNATLEQIETISQDHLQSQAKIQELEQEIAAKQQIIEDIEQELNQSTIFERVAILVDADIALEIQGNLNQYVVDIETIYSDIRLLTYSGNWKSPEEVRAFIQDLYYSSSGISGVILVGELPYAIWEYFPGDIGPLPYYYEDLDGIFQDQNKDGILDYHIEDNQKPEIWVSWMRPHSDNIAQSINDYLQKSHLYYSGNISYQDKALVAIDPDWIDATTEVTLALLQIYQKNNITVINGTAGISPQEYLSEYTKQYEFTSVWSHSDNDKHEFARGDLTATTINSLDNGSKIILIWGCHAADFYKSPYKGDILASSYVFNNNGMTSIAATRSIGIENYWIVISGLAEGDIIGEAFLKWICYSYNQIFIENRFPDEEFNKFMWGFILMGDPFIQLNKFQQLLN